MLPRFAVGGLILAVLATHADAQSVWNTGDGGWNSAANWSPTVVPASDSVTSLIFGGSSSYTATNDIGAFTLNKLQFNNTAGTVTLDASTAANTLSLVNSAALPSVSLRDAGSATVSADMTWGIGGGSVVNSGSGMLVLSGDQAFANGTKPTFINSGTGSIVLPDGLIYSSSGGGTGLVLNLINNNPGTGTFDVGNFGALGNVTINVGGTGTVRFSGDVNGGLLSSSAGVNVQSGATFDMNGNPESLAFFSGAGTLRSAVGFTVSATGHHTFSGTLTGGAATVAVDGANHTLILSGSASDYTGATSVVAGRLIVSANAPSNSAGALGKATSEVLVGDTDTAATTAASLLIDTAGVTIGRNIRLRTGGSGPSTVGGINTAGTVTYGGAITMGTNNSAAKGVVLTSAAGGSVVFSGNLLRATGATGTTDTLTVIGGGTITLAGSNSFTGATSVNGSTLVLDHTTSNVSKLSSTAGLALAGGSLSVLGSGTANTTATVAGVTLGSSGPSLGGGARVTVTSGTNRNAALVLGAITRLTGATADFSTISNGSGVASITTSTANNATGILGPHATFARDDWAVNDGTGKITPLAAGSYSSSFGSGLHTSLAGSTALPSGGATTSTLRFTAASATAVSFDTTTAGTLTLESGGLLMTSGAGAVTIGGTTTTTRGALTSTTNEIIVHQQSTSTSLTINSVIGGSNGITKTGNGTLALTAANTFTGTTYINGGTVSASATSNLGANAAPVVINGGTLALPSGTFTAFSATVHPITVGAAGATFNFTTNVGLAGAGLSGTGTLTKTGTGALSVGTSSSTFTGAIVIAGGRLVMNSSQFGSVASITVLDGATYEVNDDATGTFSFASSGRFSVVGNGVGGNGVIRVTDQSPTVAVAGRDPRTTLDREIAFQGTSRIQVDNGTGIGSLSQLTLTGNVTGAGDLVKSGGGLLIMTARGNTYDGATRIENGTLRLNLGSDRLPTGTTVTLGAGTTSGMLQLNGYAQTVAGLGTSGTGTANSVTGGSATTTSILTVNVASGTQTYAGALGGTGVNSTHTNNNLAFVKEGAGTMVLSGASTHSGATTVSQGTLVLDNTRALGNGGASLTLENGGTSVLDGGTLDLNGKTGIQEVITLNGNGVAGAGALVNNSATPASIGGGVASLSASASSLTGWSGSSTVSLDPSGGGANATAAPLLGLTAASLTVTNGGTNFTVANPVVTLTGGGGSGALVTPLLGVTAASYTLNSGTTTYSVAPTFTLQNGASGVANLDGSGKVVSITITNPGSGFVDTPSNPSFTGGTVLAAGTNPTLTGTSNRFTVVGFTIVNPGTGYTSAPTVTITGGTGATAVANDSNFVLNGFAITDNGDGYTSTPTVSINGGTGTATANLSAVKLASDSSIGGSGDLAIHAVVSGDHALTKVGGGTTTLAANNTYTGTTTVSAGTLQVGIAGVGRSGTGTVALNGASAVLAGTGSVENTISVMLGTIRPGDNGGSSTGTLNTKSLVFSPASSTTVAEMQIVSAAAFDALNITGDVTLNSSSNIFVNGSGYTAAVGDSFTLLDWSGLITTNGFATGSNLRTGNNLDGNEGNLDLPDVSGVGLWQISDLINGGALTITVVGVPEPTRGVLVMVGGAALVMRRRRSGRVVG